MKILIVDDDPNTIQMIEDSIPWNNYGIDEVYHAYQGVMGMEIVTGSHPEIIISDIEMPQMGGMKFLEKVAGEYDEMPEFIILTCHEDFSYYRTAIHYGVTEYLLKPFRQDELAAVLSKAVARILRKNREGALRRDIESREALLAANQDILIQSFLTGLFSMGITGERSYLRHVVQDRRIPFDVDVSYYLLYVGTAIDASSKKNISESEYYFIFGNIASEVLSDRVNYPALVRHTLRPYYLLVLAIPENSITQDELVRRCNHLGDTARQYLDVNLTCLIADHCRVEKFGEIAGQMDEAYLQKGTLQAETLFLHDEIERIQSHEVILDQDQIAKLIRDRKSTELILNIREVMKEMREASLMDHPHMLVLQNDLAQVFYSYLYQNHIQAYQVFQDEISRKLMETAPYSVAGMIRFVSYLYDSTIHQIDQIRQSDTVVEKARKFIEHHYREKIGREEIAASVYLAPNYLSKIFRERTGYSLREYINQCRVEEAKHQMSITDRTLTDIAMDVGFDNIPYFSTVFKKLTGMTPASWRTKVHE